MIKRSIVIFMILVSCAACTPQSPDFDLMGPRHFRDPQVVFHRQANKLVAITGNQNCAAGQGNGPGCVKFAQGTLGVLQLKVQGPGGDNNCQSSAPTPQYVITEVKVTDRQDGTTENGLFPPSAGAQAWLAAAFPTIDVNTGVVYEAYVNPPNPGDLAGTPRAVIINLNNHQGVKNIWYQVTASPCAGGSSINSDPRIRNHGV